MKIYSILLLVASISLMGCQTTEMVPSKIDTIKKDSQAIEITSITTPNEIEEKDSDGDGVMDSIDACPGTPFNIVVDERGCPTPVEIIEEPTDDSYALYFESSSEIKSITYDRLNHISEFLENYDEGVMLVEGHIGKHENYASNDSLAKDRAEAIKSYVVSNYDIDPKRIKAYDCGDTRPIAPNDTLEGREMNQRSHILITSRFPESHYECR